MRFVRNQESGSFHGGSRWQRGVHRPGATIDASRGASEALLSRRRARVAGHDDPFASTTQ